jgi:hypothetical protein
MPLEKIIVAGIPRDLDLSQLNLIQEHVAELAKIEIKINKQLKKKYPNLNATTRRIILSEDTFKETDYLYHGSIRYLIRDFDYNSDIPAYIPIAEMMTDYII